ncbi:hypothetical protein T484DRAFT_3466976 [Baffinella frigidus]|nr:hypothetical protein T484DRAFT_3466976 [Cryptophyta sp. CCMP2293]
MVREPVPRASYTTGSLRVRTLNNQLRYGGSYCSDSSNTFATVIQYTAGESGTSAVTSSGHGAASSVTAVTGGARDILLLARLPATFTICSVSRYENATHSDNTVLGVLSSWLANWYHGHFAGTAGVFAYSPPPGPGPDCLVEACIGGLCFVRLCDAVTSSEAPGACAAWGGHLASIKTAAQLQAVHKSLMSFVMPDPHAGGWLGASNYEGGSPWVWDDGSALDYTLLQYASPSQGVIYAYPSGVLYISATSSTVAAKYPICSKASQASLLPPTDWMVMCGQNAGEGLVLANGVPAGDGALGQGGFDLVVNNPLSWTTPDADSFKGSAWSVSEVAIWGRALTRAEMEAVSAHLLLTLAEGRDIPFAAAMCPGGVGSSRLHFTPATLRSLSLHPLSCPPSLERERTGKIGWLTILCALRPKRFNLRTCSGRVSRL